MVLSPVGGPDAAPDGRPPFRFTPASGGVVVGVDPGAAALGGPSKMAAWRDGSGLHMPPQESPRSVLEDEDEQHGSST